MGMSAGQARATDRNFHEQERIAPRSYTQYLNLLEPNTIKVKNQANAGSQSV